jgi:hypothetical protein
MAKKREELALTEDIIEKETAREEIERLEKKKDLAARGVVEGICPGCGKEMDGHKCRFCGVTKTINQVSGNAIFMRNGRIVSAFADEKTAYVQMAQKYQIPKEMWPKQFKEG